MFLEEYLSIILGTKITAFVLLLMIVFILIKKKSWLHLLWILLFWPAAIILSSIFFVSPSINYDIQCKTYDDYKRLISDKVRYVELPEGVFEISGRHSMGNWEIVFKMNSEELKKYIESKSNGVLYSPIRDTDDNICYRSPIADNGAHSTFKIDGRSNIIICSGSRW